MNTIGKKFRQRDWETGGYRCLTRLANTLRTHEIFFYSYLFTCNLKKYNLDVVLRSSYHKKFLVNTFYKTLNAFYFSAYIFFIPTHFIPWLRKMFFCDIFEATGWKNGVKWIVLTLWYIVPSGLRCSKKVG